jgi:hypothetical protein
MIHADHFLILLSSGRLVAIDPARAAVKSRCESHFLAREAVASVISLPLAAVPPDDALRAWRNW